MVKNPDNELINFYELMPKELQPKTLNPGFHLHGMALPSRILIVGSSGAMKTNACLNIIEKMKGSFVEIIVMCQDTTEPLYAMLAMLLPVKLIEIQPGKIIPDMDKFPVDRKSRLIIFDDLCLLSNKQQQPIINFFIRGRKLGYTSIYLTQSYYSTPKIIRGQCNYIILKKIQALGDLGYILREYKLGVSKQDLLDLYENATHGEKDFLMIDLQTNESGKKYRRNFLEYYRV